MKDGEIGFSQRLARGAAWGTIGVGLSAAAAAGFANHAEAETTFGAHEVTVSPTLDGHATLELPGVAKARLPADAPLSLGVNIQVANTNNLSSAVRSDMLIAANPEGEIDSIHREVRGLLIESGLKGAGMGILATSGLFLAIRRGREKGFSGLQMAGTALSGIAGGVIAGLYLIPGNVHPRDNTEEWSNLAAEVPLLKEVDNDQVQEIQVNKTAVATGAVSLVNSFISTYETAQDYYSDLAARAALLGPELRQPQDSEIVFIQVSDRHDNILMDPVARAIGDAAQARGVIDSGDDTSVGGEWEAFSLNSLNSAFEGYEYKIAVPGNHDEGHFVAKSLDELDWHVLNGKPEEIGGIMWLGEPDPESSGLGNWKNAVGMTVEEQSAELRKTACEAGDVDTLVTHDPDSAKDTVASGCVPLAINGHKHIQIGPDETVGDNGKTVVSYTNGTTGGAAYAFALGSKNRRDAQVTLITYKDGKPIGLQPVIITTAGSFQVEDFYTLPVENQNVAEAEPNKHDGSRLRPDANGR